MAPERVTADRTARSSRLERLTTHRALGPVIFLAAMWLAFKLTTDVAAPFVDWIDGVVSGPLRRWVAGGLGAVGLGATWVGSLVGDGLLGGVGAVLAFLPVLLALYAALAVLEQSGYLARGAYVVDGAMRVIGLPGRAFLPMMLGFGCTVPAALALRSLERPRDRVLAGMLVPFMSCGARLPVYMLLATAFFVEHRTAAVFGMYVLGMAVAAVLGSLLGRTVLRGPLLAAPAVEPPPLRLPGPGAVWSLMRRRTGDFLRDAGTVILLASMVVWLLLATPVRGGGFGTTDVEDSAFAAVSRVAAPALDPLGFGDWRQAGALASGLVAKEVVVSSLALTYATEDRHDVAEGQGFWSDLGEIGGGFLDAASGALRSVPGIVGIDLDGESGEHPASLVATIRAGFDSSSGGNGAAAGLAFMVFALLYTPCAAALAALRRELGTAWTAGAAIGQLALAWVMAFLAYRIGSLAGLG
jgi:ferrous iron transport protein B